ncbi:hypothetical protein MNBD_GAMMA26-1250 [hydrothermal vent metagenome]|uniref:Glycosyl transferase family 1 domain-containing protein n=1 Tax=hydrothermal vent metagenome TaxID=652676 RepID=A0A3B1BI55_9ZZZZ
MFMKKFRKVVPILTHSIMDKIKIKIVSKHIICGHGTTEIRCYQPAKYMKSIGWDVVLGQLYHIVPNGENVIIVHRVLMDDYTRLFLQYAKLSGSLLIYDTDDLIFNRTGVKDLDTARDWYRRNVDLYATAVSYCDLVSVSTLRLKSHARELNSEVNVIRNALSEKYLYDAEIVYDYRQSKPASSITIGYMSGSRSHDCDFAVVESALFRILDERPDVRLVIYGELDFSRELLKYGEQFEHRNFVEYEKYPYVFQDVDINIIPLRIDSEFCQSKSEIKYIEAAACGVPSIASPTQVHKEVITHGENGLLSDDHEWYEQLIQYIDDGNLRLLNGVNAREHIQNKYSPEVRASDWSNLIESYLDRTSLISISPHVRLYLIILKARMLMMIARRKTRAYLSACKKMLLQSSLVS